MHEQDFTIHSIGDWPAVEQRLRKHFSLMPEFNKDVSRLCKTISQLISKASQCDVLYRQTRKQKYLDEIENYLTQSNTYITRFNKIWLFAQLSR
jgi:hypothetical protein